MGFDPEGYAGGAFDGNVHRPLGTTDARAVSISMIFADYDYVETMGMEVVAGRNFSLDFSTDQNAYMLNQRAVELLDRLRRRLEPQEQWPPQWQNDLAAAYMSRGSARRAQGQTLGANVQRPLSRRRLS